MFARRPWLNALAAYSFAVFAACSDSEPTTHDASLDDGSSSPDARTCDGGTVVSGAWVGEVWLAQTHVQRIGGQPELDFAAESLSRQLRRDGAQMLKLVGGRDTLVKVDVPASAVANGAFTLAVDVLGPDGTALWTATLDPPTAGPESFATDPGEIRHDLATSFTALLPGEHIVPGMRLLLRASNAGAEASVTHAVDVGAPTVLRLTMFDFDYFRTRGDRILADAVNDEVGWKLPVRELRVERVDTLVSRAAFYPQEQTVDGVRHRTPWIAATSFEDWAAQAESATGVSWDAVNGRSVDHSQALLGALMSAGAQLYIVSMHGNFNDGTRGSFKGRGGSLMMSSSTSSNVLNARNLFVHELSHNFALWHWHEAAGANYPYKGAMFGVADSANGTHCGPVWRWRPPAFGDGPKGAFVAPYVTSGDGTRRYRRVVSTSGSRDDRATEFEELVGTFSDWDARAAQEWFESVVRVWNGERGAWTTWDDATKSYSRPVGGTPGVTLPLDAEPVRVYSVLAAVSTAAPDANLVYAPVGPYDSGLVRRFDPREASQVAEAGALSGYCPEGGCDYSVRVTQGGTTRVMMLRAAEPSEGTDPTSDDALRHVAVNVPAPDGAIDRIELLATPNAERDGMPASPRVLDVWTP